LDVHPDHSEKGYVRRRKRNDRSQIVPIGSVEELFGNGVLSVELGGNAGFDCLDVAHVLLWFAVFVAFDVIKMDDSTPSVYRENCFSVDLRENPMFAGVKQGSNLSQVDVT
jgi:hypothetical protein